MTGPVSRLWDMAWVLLIAAPLLVAAEVAPAQTYAVTTKPNVEYVVHEGVKLTGDFYLPKGLDKAPVIVAVHGGGWPGRQPRFAQCVGAVHGAEWLRSVCHSLPAGEARRPELSGRRL